MNNDFIPKTRTRDKMIQVRATEKEFKDFIEVCKKYNMTQIDFINFSIKMIKSNK